MGHARGQFRHQLELGTLSPGASVESLAVGATTPSGSSTFFYELDSSDGTKFTLISYGTNTWNSGLFTYEGNELANGEQFSAGLNDWEIRYDDPTGGLNFTTDQLAGNSVTIMAVPEPSAIAMLSVGGLVLAALSRFRFAGRSGVRLRA